MSVMKRASVLKCVCCVDGCYEANGFARDDAVYHWGSTPADHGLTGRWDENGYYSSARCHKLLIWTGVSIASNTIPNPLGSPDHVIETQSNFGAPPYGGAFYADWPTNTTFLDYEPYWWSTCQRGGWATTTIAREPTGTQLNTMWGGTPVPDGTYDVLVGVRAWRRYKPSVPAGSVDDIVSEANGRFMVTFISMQA